MAGRGVALEMMLRTVWLRGSLSLLLAGTSCQRRDTPATEVFLPGLMETTVTGASVSWPSIGNDLGGTRFSPLTETSRGTVSRLRLAWSWRTREVPHINAAGDTVAKPGRFQATPLAVNDTLYLPTSLHRVVALDARNGAEIWSFDPFSYRRPILADGPGFVHRGVALWSGPRERRVFLASRGRLYAVDAATGRLISGFGRDGMVDLTEGLRWPVDPDHITNTSPPAVIGNLVIVGSSVPDELIHRRDPPGDVQAFDTISGRLIWRWSPVPEPGAAGSETWLDGSAEYTGHANVWSAMAVDSARGLVYLPVSTPSNDWYGGARKGDNLYAESLVCLDARTGRVVWYYQLVHHGLWDYDPAGQPSLIRIPGGSGAVDAVALPGKTGFLYAFERASGRPLWPIEERPVPGSTVPGEAAALTQPVPVRPQAFARQGFSTGDLVDFTPELRRQALERVRGLRTGPLFTPPSLEGTVVMPGWIGGAGWGGAAFDPETSTLYVKATNRPTLARLVTPEVGGGSAPPRFVADFAALTDTTLVIRLPGGGSKRGATRSRVNLPISKPPYGTLTSIDMRSGMIRWQVTVGDLPAVRNHPSLRSLKLPPLGVPGAPGPIVTAGGLVFLTGGGAALYALDKDTGTVLWEHDLGQEGYANPMTYRTSTGRQYLVIATGAGETARLMAFTLEEGR